MKYDMMYHKRITLTKLSLDKIKFVIGLSTTKCK